MNMMREFRRHRILPRRGRTMAAMMIDHGKRITADGARLQRHEADLDRVGALRRSHNCCALPALARKGAFPTATGMLFAWTGFANN